MVCWNFDLLKSTLPRMKDEALEEFMRVCIEQGLPSGEVKGLRGLLSRDELKELTPAEIYEDVSEGKPIQDNIKAVALKVEDYSKEDVLQQFEEMIKRIIESAESPMRVREESAGQLPPLDSFSGFMRLILSVVAASSKMGNGTEENCAVPDPVAFEFAKALINVNPQKGYHPLELMLQQLNHHKKAEKINDHSSCLLFPMYFFYGAIALHLGEAELYKLSNMKGSAHFTEILKKPKKLKEIMLSHSNPECLTECAIKAKVALLKLENDQKDELSCPSLEYDKNCMSLAIALMENSKAAIKARLHREDDDGHLGHARQFYCELYPQPSSPSVRRSTDSVTGLSTSSSSFLSPPRVRQSQDDSVLIDEAETVRLA